MGLAQGTTSCVSSDHSEKPARVSSSKRTCKCSSVGFTSSRWVKRFGEEVIHTLGTPQQQLCTRPPRWWVNEMTGHILILAPRGRRNREGAGRRRIQFAGFKFAQCEGVWRHLYALWHLHSICPLYWDQLRRGWSSSAKYHIKAYLLRWGKKRSGVQSASK